MVDLYFVMSYEYAIGFCGLLMLIPLIKRLRKRKSAVTRYLVLCIFFLLAATIFAGTSRLFRITGWWNFPNGQQLELTTFTVTSVAISDVFMLAFSLEVFKEGAFHGKNRVYILISVFISIAFAIYVFTTGLFVIDLTYEIWMILIIFSVVVYIFLIRSAFHYSHKTESVIEKRGMQLIGIGPIFLLTTFGLFTVDRLFGANFTPYYYIAWIFALGFVFITYLGYVQPDWYKRRINDPMQGSPKTSKSDLEAET